MVESIVARRAALGLRHPVWEPQPIDVILDKAVQRYADRPLIITDVGVQSYAEVGAGSRRLAAGLAANGIGRGDRIALIMANFAEFALLKFAAARLGATCVSINYNLRGADIVYALQQSRSRMLITMHRYRDHDYVDDISASAPGWRTGRSDVLPDLTTAFIFSTEDPAAFGSSSYHTLLDAPASGGPARSVADAADVSEILYTSGTTGKPKGVMLTHDMILRAGYASAFHRAFEDGRRIAHVLPMYHVFGYVECLIASLFVGGAVIMPRLFDPDQFLTMAETHGATEIVALPTTTMKLLEHVARRGFDSSRLTAYFNSGGLNPPGIWTEIREAFRADEIMTAYGMTETTASATCTLPEGDDIHLSSSNGCLKFAGSAGDPELGGFTAVYRALDPVTGEELAAGQTGELVVKGPIVTPGYFDKPQESEAARTRDGWLRTGDLGYITGDGYLTLTGRIKESYRCGGELVVPRDVELAIEDHPGVRQAFAVGIPDVRMGEVGCLLVIPHEDCPDPDELLALCASRLARFKVPRHVLFIVEADVPLTATGRPQKHLLATMAKERLAMIAPRLGAIA